MGVKVISPTCNLETVKDGRGGIFTWVPEEPILEFNLLYFTPGATRGFHYHPEFIEYLLCVEGDGVLVVEEVDNLNDVESDAKTLIHLSKGVCTRTDIGTSHTVYAITSMSIIAMLTKPWDECNPPIIRINEN